MTGELRPSLMTVDGHRVRDAARVSAKIGAYIAFVTFTGVVVSFATGKAPALYLIESPAAGFGIYFVAAFILQISGAVRHDGRQLLVNPWFAWTVIGAFVVFIVTLLILGHPVIMPPHILEWSAVAAAGWVGAVVLVWAAARALGHRPATIVAATSPHLEGANFADASAVSPRSGRFLGSALLFIAVICIGIALGTSGPWKSTQTKFVLLGVITAWQGITKLRSRD
jgi:hypothetical protein